MPAEDEVAATTMLSGPEKAALITKEAECLIDTKRPLKDRFRALFALRNLGGDEAISAINSCFEDESALLKHECAYCLGQMQDVSAVPFLNAVLEDEHQDVMVRHEAAEALGAIGMEDSLDILQKFADHAREEIRETCEIAIDRINFLLKQKDQKNEADKLFWSVDPAPALEKEAQSVQELKATLLDTSKSLFERYRAMFSLRNLNSEESVLALCAGLDDKSALFRHEIGYVLGQLQHPAAIAALVNRLEDGGENYMVRHECAEALGSIGKDECLPALEAFKDDASRVVKESCIVALDMHEHETSGDFQYASTE